MRNNDEYSKPHMGAHWGGAGAGGASLAMVVALAREQNDTTSPSSEEHYKWGMFYYNPAVLVLIGSILLPFLL